MPTYSLWLELPPGPAREALAAAIRRAACTGGGGPTFSPHVTLAGGLDLPGDGAASAAATAVARGLPAEGLPVRLARKPTVGSTYTQSVYFLADPGQGLVAAAAAAAQAGAERRGGGKATSSSPPPPYMPHLSLLYSTDEATKAAVVAGLAEGGGKDGEEEEGGTWHAPSAWTRVTAWRTEGPVEGWECVADVGAGGVE